MCRYPWFTLSWYSTPTYQRCFQRSHHHLGKWLYQGHSFWLRSQEDSRWYWPLVSLSHLLESTYLLTKFHLHCHLLVSTTFCKAKALCSGQVTTQKHWWRYACRYFCPVFTETWIMHRFICWLFKAMYLIKWSRLFKLSLNFAQSHSTVYYMYLIQAFGAPNGLYSSIMEFKHIVAVKEPWQHLGWWDTLRQVLTTNSHLDKLAAAWVDFTSCGMLAGTVLEDILCQLGESLLIPLYIEFF